MPHAESETATPSARATAPAATGVAGDPFPGRVCGGAGRQTPVPSSRQSGGIPHAREGCHCSPDPPSRSGRADRGARRPRHRGDVRVTLCLDSASAGEKGGRWLSAASGDVGMEGGRAPARPNGQRLLCVLTFGDFRVCLCNHHRHREGNADTETPRLPLGGAQGLPAL